MKLKELLKAIADAVRTKLNISDLINPQNLPQKIREIKTPADGSLPKYQGPFMVTPGPNAQTIQTEGKYSEANITVAPAPPSGVEIKSRKIEINKFNQEVSEPIVFEKNVNIIGVSFETQKYTDPSYAGGKLRILGNSVIFSIKVASGTLNHYQYYLPFYNPNKPNEQNTFIFKETQNTAEISVRDSFSLTKNLNLQYNLPTNKPFHIILSYIEAE